MLEIIEEKTQSKQALEVTCKAHEELESRVKADEEQVRFISKRVKINEEENCTLKHKSSKLEAEIESFMKPCRSPKILGNLDKIYWII